MSEINCYQHRLLGFVECPTKYPQLVVSGRTGPISVAVYELLEAAPIWSANPGDILVGGGAGECPAFRISMPIAGQLLLDGENPEFRLRTEICQSYWSPAQAFALCDAFLHMGWKPGLDVEFWLAEYVLLKVRQQCLLSAPLR
jgi:hypothetical protein